MKPNDANEPRWGIKPAPPTPYIKVRVWMRHATDGGHQFFPAYRPHLVVKGKETYWGIWVLSITRSSYVGMVSPGEEAELEVGLMYYQEGFEYDDLKRGATFEIREGGRTVGTGIVLSDFEW